jgi:polysaccharide pyruvyl transferase WcaK-like protein
MTIKPKDQILLPRVIYGNRGDILSRWGLINGLTAIGQDDLHLFAHQAGDLPIQMRTHFEPYGKYHNLFLSHKARSTLRNADRILWGGGLDLTDESSKAKLLYLLATFSQYRMAGKEINCVFQGAGPLVTRTGRIVARQILQRVSHFVARDEYTYSLIHQLNPGIPLTLAGDAIFFPGFEQQLDLYSDASTITHFLGNKKSPVIALNLRRWFHFSSDLVPFQLAKKRYESRGLEQMNHLMKIYIDLVQKMRSQFDARVLLVSAYNPGVYSWEDDLQWLEGVKAAFPDDHDVCLVNDSLEMLDYLALMAKVDLALSMRLHTSLTVMRFGNPAVNISYSPKGVNAFCTLGMKENAFDINSIMQDPAPIWHRIETILKDLHGEKEKVIRGVNTIMVTNMQALNALFSGADD